MGENIGGFLEKVLKSRNHKKVKINGLYQN